MKITDLLKVESIDLQAEVVDKRGAVNRLVDLMEKSGCLKDKEAYKAAVLKREGEGSTGIGEGIAIPHAKTDAVVKPALASMIVRTGVDYESLDDEPAHLFFMIAAPADGADVHLEVLSRLSRMLMDDDFREALMSAPDRETYLKVIDSAEQALAVEGSEDAEQEAVPIAVTERPFVVAVTACPTGIAHTYMAAEALENKGSDMGIEIKVETNGSGGVKNAGRRVYKHLMNGVSYMLPFVIGGGILIALAFLFDMNNAGTATFGSGTPVAAFLKDIGGLAFSMMMPILAGYIAVSIGERPALMPGIIGGFLAANGGSGFFGALFAGFIAGYVIIFLKKVFAKLPQALEGTKPVLLYPVFGLILIGLIMVFVVNPPTAVFNQWLSFTLAGMTATSKIFLGLILGGMMSIDFGGPINKAAYVFGTASLVDASGTAVSSGIMASVMIGGMVPPIAIALAMLVFKGKFTEKERQSTLTNFIMGLSFITEGAIPFAASDPVHVIPSCAVGSAVAGALSMFFNCTVPAPHGGIFVFGVVTNWPMYLAALFAGAVVAALLLGLTRKNA